MNIETQIKKMRHRCLKIMAERYKQTARWDDQGRIVTYDRSSAEWKVRYTPWH